MSLFSRIVKVLLPMEPVSAPDYGSRVEWLMLLRLLVTTFLLGTTIFFQLNESGTLFVDAAIPLYVLIGTTFLLGLIYAISLPKIPDLRVFSFFQVMVDVVYATVLVYFTGGASSVFTLLYVFPIFSSGILHFRRGALTTASVAAVLLGLLINLEYYGIIPQSDWPWMSPWEGYTSGYVLWVLVVQYTIFVFVALISSSISEQLQRTRISLNRTEVDYRKLSDLHTSIVHCIPSGIITTDEKDRITFVNSAGTDLFDKTFAEMLRVPLRSFFPEIQGEVSQTGSRSEIYRTVKEIGNRQVHLELTVSGLQDLDGTPKGRLVVFEDVTQFRKMEERVRVGEQQAAFVRIAAGMAHEIRNPLASIRGATELLVAGPSANDSEKRLLGIVIRESDRLNALLSDFLVAVTSRKSRRVRVMLSDLAVETVHVATEDPRLRRGVKLETLISKGVEVEGEPSQLRQALWNILSNAADATPDGGFIRVVLESEAQSGQAVFKVQDSGPGIPPEIRERIFEPFTTTKEKGTGLGLSLVLSVVQSHDGSVEVDSNPSSGTLFTMRLPLASPDGTSQ